MTAADPLNIPPVEVPQIPESDPRPQGGASVVFAPDTFRPSGGGAEVKFSEDPTYNSTFGGNELPGNCAAGAFKDQAEDEGMTNKANVASRRFLEKFGNPMSPAFSEAIVLPSLQFTDRTVEKLFRKTCSSSLHRIAYTVLAGWFLNTLQIWFGLYKGWHGISELHANRRATTTTTTTSATTRNMPPSFVEQEMQPAPVSSFLDWPLLSSFARSGDSAREQPAAGFALDDILAHPPQRRRCLWGRDETTMPLSSDIGLYQAACINQTVADCSILLGWWIISSLKQNHRKLEALTISVQITRVILIVLFAQGMWSECARNQGPTDIMMNNIAIASANVTYFNCVPLCRVRRGSVVTGIFVVGVLEIIIVMTQGSTGGAAISRNDAAQLTIFILIFLLTPVVALACRFRAELSEREAFYIGTLYEQSCQTNANLQVELEDLDKVRNMDIEQSLPEGLLPSKIVKVAVRELQQAERCADHLQKALPSIFLQQTKANQRRSNLEGADQRLATARKIGKAMEFAMELRDSVQSALKLLCRSHDLYMPAVHGNYAGAMLFHAVGHTVRRRVEGFPSQGWDETTECAYGDHPPSLLSRNTARKSEHCVPNMEGLDSVEQQNSRVRRETLGGGSREEDAAGAKSPNVSPHVPAEEYAENMPLFGNADFPFLSGLGEMARNIGSNWQFDMAKVTRVTKEESILTTGMLLASPIAEGIQFDWKRWFSFLRSVQNEYGTSEAIPYHNRTHSSIHAHTCAVLLDWLKHPINSTKLESLGVLISSICHDIGHPGRTNAYLVNANKRLAIIYNDISVLENYHACRTFEILMQKQNNFMSSIALDDYRYIRKVIIELILATDMKLHFELLNNYRLQRNMPSFDHWAQENKLSTLKLVMKAADLSHGAFDWPLHHVLSMQINEEFWAQGDAELAMGLPISPLCDRNISKQELASSQAGFLEFLVLPLYKELGAVDHTGAIT